jgi:hypothetical protein
MLPRGFQGCTATVAGLVLLWGTAPLSGQNIYWSELRAACNGSVVRHSTVGSTTTDDPVVSADLVSKVLLDASARQVYWSEGKKVRRANLDSPGVADIVNVTGAFSLQGFVLDLTNRKIYWNEGVGVSPCTAPNCPRIRRADLDGSNVETLFTVPNANGNISDIAVDPVASKVYWADRQFTPFISRANLNGTGVESLVTTAVTNGGVASIVLDLPGGKMYWIDEAGTVPGDSRLRSGNLDGSDQEDLVAFINGRPRPRYLALDAACGWLYWTFSGFCPNDTGDILRIDLATRAQETLFTGIGITMGIAVDSDTNHNGTSDCNETRRPGLGCAQGAGTAVIMAAPMLLIGRGVQRGTRRRAGGNHAG